MGRLWFSSPAPDRESAAWLATGLLLTLFALLFIASIMGDPSNPAGWIGTIVGGVSALAAFVRCFLFMQFDRRKRIQRNPVAKLVEIWRKIILGEHTSWVLFSHGTVVILMAPWEDLAEQAKEILREHGPVHPGSPAGDFGLTTLPSSLGWVVTGQHSDVLTYVAPEEFPGGADAVEIGLHGRSKRDLDGGELQVIHVEDRRADASR